MESDPGARDVFHDIVLAAHGEVVECLGPDTCVQEGPLTTHVYSGRSRGSLRAIPVDGAGRAFG